MSNPPGHSTDPPTGVGQFVVGASCAITAVSIWAGWLVMMRLGVTTRLSASDLTALRFATAGSVLLPVVLRRGLAIDHLGWPGFAAVGAIRKAGLVLVVWGGSMIGGLDLSNFGGQQSIGHLLFLSASFMTACYTVAIRRARIDGLHAAAIAAVVSLLLYLPVYFAFFENGLFNVPMIDLAVQALYQGVLTAAISLALYGQAVRLLGASNAAAFVALGPIMAALMAIPVLGEWPSSTVWGAILIIATGVYLASGGPLPAWRLRASVRSP